MLITCGKEVEKIRGSNPNLQGIKSFMACDLEEFYLIRPILIKVSDLINNASIHISCRNYTKDTPMLSFVGFQTSFSINNREAVTFNQTLNKIFNNYKNNFSKQAVLSLQKELIENDFVGNAKW
jgi:hypothetical protein